MAGAGFRNVSTSVALRTRCHRQRVRPTTGPILSSTSWRDEKMIEAERPLRNSEHAGRPIGILVWAEGEVWRSAWRIEAGAWHSIRGTWTEEDQAAEAAHAAAAEQLGPDGTRSPRRPRRSSGGETMARAPRSSVRSSSPASLSAPTADSWTTLHQQWVEAEAAATELRAAIAAASRYRGAQGSSGPSRAELARLSVLEAAAEEARRAMDRHLSRILRPQRRRASPGEFS